MTRARTMPTVRTTRPSDISGGEPVLDARAHPGAGGITAGDVRRHRDPQPPGGAATSQGYWFGPKLPVSNLTLPSYAAQDG